MLIPVIYTNGKHDMVKDYLLGKLIDGKEIVQFKRSDGWISISAKNVRGRKKDFHYAGPRRRLDDAETAALADLF